MPHPPRHPSPRTLKTKHGVNRVVGRATVARPADARQPGLFDQPLPAWIRPCLPTLVDEPPVGPEWVHEIKWDGYRVSAYLEAGRVAIYTRNGYNWTYRFPAIAASVAALPLHSAVIDGEAVVLDDHGRSSFSSLQAALGTRGRGAGQRRASAAVLYAFDLLFLDGHDMRDWSLANRLAALETIAGPKSPAVLLSEGFEGTGAELFGAACEHELEGIVSKRRDLPYRSGRRDEWLKTKCVRDGTFVVIGYQPSAATPSALGAVHVAEEAAGALRYVGAVGTGFSRQEAAAMQRRLDALGKPTPAVMGLRIKGARWSKPSVRVDVNYRTTTAEGLLRHASFKGVRPDAT